MKSLTLILFFCPSFPANGQILHPSIEISNKGTVGCVTVATPAPSSNNFAEGNCSLQGKSWQKVGRSRKESLFSRHIFILYTYFYIDLQYYVRHQSRYILTTNAVTGEFTIHICTFTYLSCLDSRHTNGALKFISHIDSLKFQESLPLQLFLFNLSAIKNFLLSFQENQILENQFSIDSKRHLIA